MTKDDVNELFDDDPITLKIYEILEISKWPAGKFQAHERSKADERVWQVELRLHREKAYKLALKRFVDWFRKTYNKENRNEDLMRDFRKYQEVAFKFS
jgi:uncharacterized protein YdeI (YjbR/CyaY-like superfamily)